MRVFIKLVHCIFFLMTVFRIRQFCKQSNVFFYDYFRSRKSQGFGHVQLDWLTNFDYAIFHFTSHCITMWSFHFVFFGFSTLSQSVNSARGKITTKKIKRKTKKLHLQHKKTLVELYKSCYLTLLNSLSQLVRSFQLD